ncbi:MAG: hypothetical protein ACYS0D_04320 [Planctomycetota bacterium]|jgi:hypothetical protein
MIRCPMPMLVLLVTTTASAAVIPPASPEIRGAHERPPGGVLSHGNSPDDVGGYHDTPISVPLPGPWSIPWELVTDFAAPRTGAIEWLTGTGSRVEPIGATPVAQTPVPAPSGLTLIGLGVATVLGRRRRVR